MDTLSPRTDSLPKSISSLTLGNRSCRPRDSGRCGRPKLNGGRISEPVDDSDEVEWRLMIVCDWLSFFNEKSSAVRGFANLRVR